MVHLFLLLAFIIEKYAAKVAIFFGSAKCRPAIQPKPTCNSAQTISPFSLNRPAIQPELKNWQKTEVQSYVLQQRIERRVYPLFRVHPPF